MVRFARIDHDKKESNGSEDCRETHIMSGLTMEKRLALDDLKLRVEDPFIPAGGSQM